MELSGNHGVNNPGLLDAMRLMSREDNTKSRGLFYQELLKGTFLVPLADVSQVLADGTIPEGRVDFVMARSDEGNLYMLAFTDMWAIRKWKPLARGRTAVMPGKVMFRTAVENGIEGIVINHKNRVGATVTRAEFESLADEMMPAAAGDAAGELLHVSRQPSLVRPPARWPYITLADRIKSDFRTFPEVVEAFLFEVQGGEDTGQLTIGLLFVRGVEEQRVRTVVEAVGEGMKPFLRAHERIDLLPLNEDMLAQVRAIVPPFYRG